MSTRAKAKSSSTPKVDGESLEPNAVDEGEAEVVVVVEAENYEHRAILVRQGC